MQTILITGINGFLGSHLAKKLKENYKIIGLEINPKDLWRLNNEQFTVYGIDNGSINALFNDYQIDYIIHTATLYGRDGISNSNLIENNVLFPIQLIETALSHQLKAFINTDSFFNSKGTNYSYLQGYTLTKKHLTAYLKLYTDRLKIVNMKLFHMYGPGDAPDKFIPWIINRLKHNDPVIDLTKGEQTRDFVYVGDVVSAFNTVCDKIDHLSEKYISLEIGSGKAISLRELIETAKKIIKSSSTLNFGALPYRDGEIMCSQSDNSMNEYFEWKAQYDIYNGLMETIHAE